MGSDGAATFSGDKTGVQRRLKEHSPHALFVHCHCHVLQLASVQAANATPDKTCLHYPDDVREALSLLTKTCRVIKGDLESTRSSIV